MARVKNKDSKAELNVRRRLHALGYRYRVQHKIVGKPDIAFTRLKLAIFIDGDMWHGNAWRLRNLPNLAAMFPNRTEWWVAKIERNMERDYEVNTQLQGMGWKVLRFWESQIDADIDKVISEVEMAIKERRDDVDRSVSAPCRRHHLSL